MRCRLWLWARQFRLALLAALICWYWFIWRFWLALGSRRHLLRLTATLAPSAVRQLPKRFSSEVKFEVIPPKALDQVPAPVVEVLSRRWLLLPTVVVPIEEQSFALIKPTAWSAAETLQALGLNKPAPWLEQVLLAEAGDCARAVTLFLVRREVRTESLMYEFARRQLHPASFSSAILFLHLHDLYWPKNSRILAVGGRALNQQGERLALCATHGQSAYSQQQLTGGANLSAEPYYYRNLIAWPWPRSDQRWPADAYFLGEPLNPLEGS